MTHRENYISIARRRGFDYMPVRFPMCPSLQARFDAYLREHELALPVGEGRIDDLPIDRAPDDVFLKNYYRRKTFKPGTRIDHWGVAHEPGSAAAYHMTYMHHPMEDFDSVEQIEAYPFPVFRADGLSRQTEQAEALHAADQAVIGDMQCTVWETA